MTKQKLPTIKNLLACLPAGGVQSNKDALTTYASLSFYFDGQDMKKAKVTDIKAKQELIDSLYPKPTYEITEVDNGDAYLLTVEGLSSYKFNVPTLETMPEVIDGNIVASVRQFIDKLAEDPKQVLELPFNCFEGIGAVMGKSIGL